MKKYKMQWKSKNTGIIETGPVLMKEVENEKECWLEPMTRKEAEERADSCNKKFKMAKHWVV